MGNMASPYEVTPQAAKEQLNDRKETTLIDVREPEEFALARIEGAELIPMGTVPAELQKLEGLADARGFVDSVSSRGEELASDDVVEGAGIENCFSVAGGIDRWSWEVDPSVPRY